MNKYSWYRLWAVIVKEFIQMMRDKGTLTLIVGVPLVQLITFGFAINTNPHYLPTVVIAGDQSLYTRDFLQGLENSTYFHITQMVHSEAEAEKLIRTSKTLFVITIPPNFTRDFVRGDRPSILVEADGSDPSTSGQAFSAITQIAQSVFNYHLRGSLHYLLGTTQKPSNVNTNPEFSNTSSPVDLRIHVRYNPESITQINVVPALIGVILTLTMVMVTSIAITRERERGTMENLLAMPIQPIEVMTGKVVPFIIVGYIQITMVIVAAVTVFHVPHRGSILFLFLCALPFIAANLTVGVTLSSIAQNQLQSIQLAIFFFLPSIFLSGYVFPFDGMPGWAQWIGQALPLTHFLRIIRGILLKGNGFAEVWIDLWPIFLFFIVMMFVGIKRYRRTLD